MNMIAVIFLGFGLMTILGCKARSSDSAAMGTSDQDPKTRETNGQFCGNDAAIFNVKHIKQLGTKWSCNHRSAIRHNYNQGKFDLSTNK